MKKICILILAALCALLPFASAATQESTTIMTVVPDHHTIAIDCTEGGGVIVDGQRRTGQFTLEVPRLGTLTLPVVPDDGWSLSQVIASSDVGIVISDKGITLEDVYEDKALTIHFLRLSPTPTPVPSATESPETPAVPVELLDNALYDGYLGTGQGLGQLSIVFDANYDPQDYELLPILADGDLLIRARPDEKGRVATRSLILSARQIQRLSVDCAVDRLLFQNGGMMVTASMEELCGGRVARLMNMGQELSKIDLEAVSWDELPEPELTAAQLEQARIEICVEPVTLQDGRDGYSVGVFLRMGNERLDISPIIDSLAVNMSVDWPALKENLAPLEERYSIAVANPPEEQILDSEPRILLEDWPDASERFSVTIPRDASDPAVLYSDAVDLRPYYTIVLTAPYAGLGAYVLQENALPTESPDA